MMRYALDTNVLAYAEGVNDAHRAAQALDLLARLPQDETVVPVQVLGELFAVLVRKAGRTPVEARESILQWRDTFSVAETTPEIMLKAADLAADHNFSIWDGVILCAASAAGCRLLLSEDLQEGFTWGGVTVVSPFAATAHPLLAAILKD